MCVFIVCDEHHSELKINRDNIINDILLSNTALLGVYRHLHSGPFAGNIHTLRAKLSSYSVQYDVGHRVE